jgi:DNA repair protein RadC
MSPQCICDIEHELNYFSYNPTSICTPTILLKKIIMNNKNQLPRYKLQCYGVESLSDTELIATLISTGSKEHSLMDLANIVLEKSEAGIYGLGRLSLEDITKIPGIGDAKAAILISALELGRRRTKLKTPQRQKIAASIDIYEQFSFLADLPHEEFWILLLRHNNTIIGKWQISKGGIASTIVDTRLILKKAIDSLATGIVLCHNHPSGESSPSQADVGLTRRLKEAARIVNMEILDHIIVAEKSYYSFSDNGLI